MIDIRDIRGNIRFSTSIKAGAVGKFSLMKEDYIVLPFNTLHPIDFQVSDYVDLRGAFDASMGGKLAKIYQIVDIPYPTYRNGGYSYELRLDAYYWQWKTKIFKYTPEVGGQEASWNLTASLDVQMGVFLRNLKALGYTYGGKNFTFSIDSSVETSSKLMTYDNINLIDAMFSMADNWGCDCWVTDHVINFGRCEFSDAVKIELDKEAKDMSRSDSKGTYATRIYAFGSTRNIPTNYRPVDHSTVVNGIVQKRLMLPAGTPYVDAREDLTDLEAIEAVVVFDDIYPKRVGEITDVNSYESEVDNEDGTKTKATFYRFTDTGINFSKEYILEGQELKIKFESGKLNGMEFGVAFNPLGLTEKNDDGTFNSDAQLWEIVQNEDYGRPLPDEVLLPAIGDKYVLSGWNAEKITELGLVATAEQELLEAARKYVAKTCIDDGTYTATLNSIWVYEDQINHSFDIGQRISLINPAYFKNGRLSRVIGFEIKLDLPYDSPQYTIGESTPYSRISDIETQVEELTFKRQTFTGSGGSNIYVIKTNDATAASNFNVFSALCTLRMFLRKDFPDVAEEIITFLKGLLIGKNGSGITVREDGTSQAVVDRLYVKIKAVFEELQVKKATHVGGEQIITHAGMKCIRVEELKDVYRCYFLAEQEGEAIANEFSVGSLAQAKECNIVDGTTLNASNRYYWREVMEVGRDYIDLSKTICDEGSDIPQAGDDIIGLGHRTDVDLQSTIVLSSTNETSPSITFYAGINDFNLTEKDIISFGLDKSIGHVYMKVYGTSYIGARDESTYIKYTPEGGVEIKGRFLTMAGEDILTMFSIMEGMIKSEISSVRNEINAKDNYLSNASFSGDLMDWSSTNRVRVFRVDNRLLSFNNNFYANKENLASITLEDGRSVLRLKNSSITQYNSNFARYPKFDEKIKYEEVEVPVLDADGNPVLDESGQPVTELQEVPVLDGEGNTVMIKIPRQFYISFNYMVKRTGTLTVYFKNESSDESGNSYKEEFEPYDPIYFVQSLLPTSGFQKMEIAGKWNGKGHFYLAFTGDMYLYSLALADNPLAEMEEKFTMRFEATDKKIQANLDEIRKTGTRLEEYHSEFLLTARNLRLQFTEDLSDAESRITAAYKSYVNLTARDLTVQFQADINNAETRITEAYTSAIELSAKGLQTKFTADLTDMEAGITAAYKSYVNLTAQNLEAGFTEDLTDLRTGVTEAYKAAIDLSARGLRADFNSSIADLNGKLTTHTSSFHVTASKIEAMVTATDNISNTIRTAGWITTADGNKLWATISTVDELGNKLTTHTGSFHVTASKIEAMVSATDSISNTIRTAGWITTADGNKLWATISTVDALGNRLTSHEGKFHVSATEISGIVTRIDATESSISGINKTISSSGWITTADGNKLWSTLTQYNALNQVVSTHTGSFHVTATKINSMVESIDDTGRKYSAITQTVGEIRADVNDVSGKYANLSLKVDAISAVVGDGSTGSFSEFLQTVNEISASVTEVKNGLDTHKGSFHVTADKIEAMVTATDNISNTIKTAGWITKSDGNTWWASKGTEQTASDAAKSAINAATAAADAMTRANSAYDKADDTATALVQTNSSLSAIAGRFNADGTLKEGAGWVTTADAAALYATKQTVNSLGERVTTAESRITANADSISLTVKKDGIISAINQTAESVTIDASKINLNGKVTISSLAQDVKNSIDSKVSTSSLGSLAYKDAVELAQLGDTIIEGGYLKTNLINVDTLIAKKMHADNGSYTVDVDSYGIRMNDGRTNILDIRAESVSNTTDAIFELHSYGRTGGRLKMSTSMGIYKYDNFDYLQFVLNERGLFFYNESGDITKSYPAY